MRVFNLDFSFPESKRVALYEYGKYTIRISLYLDEPTYKRIYFSLTEEGYVYEICTLTVSSSLEEDINNNIDKILLKYLEFSTKHNVKLPKQMTDLIAFI
jgi:hypothetical protein